MPTMPINTRKLDTQKLLGDVRRNNNFIVTINGVSDDNDLELVIQKAFLPSVSLNVLDLRHGNDSKKFAGVATWNGGQMSIIDTLSKDELNAVLAWFKSTYDWTNAAVGVAKDYKKTGFITEYAADGKFTRQWKVEGMWISNIDLGALDASSGELKEVALTIEIDPSRNFAPEYGPEYPEDTVDLNDETTGTEVSEFFD
jgi:hypothetical protein